MLVGTKQVASAFVVLETYKQLAINTECTNEAFVCQMYETRTVMTDVGEFRWKLFTKKQFEAQKMPQIRGALHEAIVRSHYRAIV